jgi:hypothetical protein
MNHYLHAVIVCYWFGRVQSATLCARSTLGVANTPDALQQLQQSSHTIAVIPVLPLLNSRSQRKAWLCTAAGVAWCTWSLMRWVWTHCRPVGWRGCLLRCSRTSR